MFLFILVILGGSFSFSETPSLKKEALSQLKKVLDTYNTKSIHMNVRKRIHIPIINKTTQGKGVFYFHKEKFLHEISFSSSSQRILFDGKTLWYQPNTKEKTLFEFFSHPQIDLISGIFNYKKFLKLFKIRKTEKQNSTYTFYLSPKENTLGLKEVVLSFKKYIKSFKIVWMDLENWQEYQFSNPWIKKSFPASLFKIKKEQFEILSQKPSKEII